MERTVRIPLIKEMEEAGEFSFYANDPTITADTLLMKGKIEKGTAKEHLEAIQRMIGEIDASTFHKETIKSAVWDYATQMGRGNVLWPMRTALSGKEKSPDPFTIAEAVGKEATQKRIAYAISILT